jgi:hypothetical protein
VGELANKFHIPRTVVEDLQTIAKNPKGVRFTEVKYTPLKIL